MNQHITQDQLNELTPEAKEKLHSWIYDHDYEDKLIWQKPTCGEDNCCFEAETNPLSIGQMIEFLWDNTEDKRYKKGRPDSIDFQQRKNQKYFDDSWYIQPETLCDDLWEAVKEVLESE